MINLNKNEVVLVSGAENYKYLCMCYHEKTYNPKTHAIVVDSNPAHPVYNQTIHAESYNSAKGKCDDVCIGKSSAIPQLQCADHGNSRVGRLTNLKCIEELELALLLG